MSSTITDDAGYSAFLAEASGPSKVARSHKYVFMMGSDIRGLALEDYTKNTPPGWQPYITQYPLKLYKQKLALWLKTTDVDADKIGPTVLGRIKGAAYRLIMKMRVPRQDGSFLTEAEGVSALGQAEIPAQAGYWDPQQGI